MLGYDSFFSSHDFSYCFAQDAVKRIHNLEKRCENLQLDLHYSHEESRTTDNLQDSDCSDETANINEMLDEDSDTDDILAKVLKKTKPDIKNSG